METAKALEFTSKFSFMGSIKKVATFDSKGGGLNLSVETGEIERVADIISAKGAACRITIEVSTSRANQDDDSEQLSFDEIEEQDEP